jgi:hypothetical protein
MFKYSQIRINKTNKSEQNKSNKAINQKQKQTDISLSVRGHKSIYESLNKYVESEQLTGENQYFAEGHGLQDARKSTLFITLPPVLEIHLKRFTYDSYSDSQRKVSIFLFVFYFCIILFLGCFILFR